MKTFYAGLPFLALLAACGSNAPSTDANASAPVVAAQPETKASVPTVAPPPATVEKPKSLLGQWISVDSVCAKHADHIEITADGIGMIEGGCTSDKAISGDRFSGTLTCSENGEEWKNVVSLDINSAGNLVYGIDGGESSEYKRCPMKMDYGY